MKNTQKNFKTIAQFPVLNEKELKEVLGGDLRNIFLKIKFKKKESKEHESLCFLHKTIYLTFVSVFLEFYL